MISSQWYKGYELVLMKDEQFWVSIRDKSQNQVTTTMRFSDDQGALNEARVIVDNDFGRRR
jgi:hypothetical protein